jgi:histidine triad (HIT) family protein
MAASSITMLLFIRNGIYKSALILADSHLGRRWLAWMMIHMCFALPIHHILETNTLLAFHHPQPAYPVHILLAPKKPVASLLELTEADQDFMRDLFQSVQELVRKYNLEKSGYRLIVNGGSYQDFLYLHFHLISGAQ